MVFASAPLTNHLDKYTYHLTDEQLASDMWFFYDGKDGKHYVVAESELRRSMIQDNDKENSIDPRPIIDIETSVKDMRRELYRRIRAVSDEKELYEYKNQYGHTWWIDENGDDRYEDVLNESIEKRRREEEKNRREEEERIAREKEKRDKSEEVKSVSYILFLSLLSSTITNRIIFSLSNPSWRQILEISSNPSRERLNLIV